MNTVLVSDLQKAEKIVHNNYRLHWDGWNIVYLKPDAEAWRKTNGVFADGKWHQRTVIVPHRRGWTIPKGFIC